jgi:hypothetical protein
MNDSGKFWTLANKLYAEYEQSAKKEVEYKKQEEKKYIETKYENKKYEEKKEEIKRLEPKYEEKKIENKSTNNKVQNPMIERSKKIFIQNLDKIPVDKRDISYPRIEKNILRQLETAKKR